MDEGIIRGDKGAARGRGARGGRQGAFNPPALFPSMARASWNGRNSESKSVELLLLEAEFSGI